METLTYQEIPDALWERIEPLFAHFIRTKPGGSAPTPSRTLLAGMLYRLKTGCQWSMIPEQYGSKTTLHEHYQRWVRTGVFARILERITAEFDDRLGFDFEWQAMDGSLVQAPVRKKKKHARGWERIPQTVGAPAAKYICMWTKTAPLLV